jgi:hypothetical protein
LRLNACVVSIEIPSTVEPKMADKIIIIIIKAKWYEGKIKRYFIMNYNNNFIFYF